MEKYIFEEYLDKGGIGSTAVFDTEKEAVKYAVKNWHNMSDNDRKLYLRDSNGIYRVYAADLPEDDEDIVYSDYETRDILDYIRPFAYNASGVRINYTAAVELMDDDIREDLHLEMAPCSDQAFFTAYEEAHEKKFGEEWFLSGPHPQY